jgi:hypothetical protein
MADELDALRKASMGLLYPSETDAPFDVFSWPEAHSAKDALAVQGKAKGKVEEITLDKFFAELADSDDAAKFAKLKQAITATLSEVTVFRVGAVKVDIYIIGRTESGVVGGLHTRSVET